VVNLAGLIIAFVGSLFVLWAQSLYTPLVSLVDVNVFKLEDRQEAAAHRRISAETWRARIGWGLITVGFLLQMLAAI
jgi:hypothetical protein